MAECHIVRNGGEHQNDVDHLTLLQLVYMWMVYLQ